MNKYLWAECTTDYWPSIKTIMAKSYNDAVEKVINKYATAASPAMRFIKGVELINSGNVNYVNANVEDDDSILNFDNWDEFREYLNEEKSIALSDLEIHEEI